MNTKKIILSRLEQIRTEENNFSDKWWNDKTLLISRTSRQIPIANIVFDFLDDYDIVKAFEVIITYVNFKKIKTEIINNLDIHNDEFGKKYN